MTRRDSSAYGSDDDLQLIENLINIHTHTRAHTRTQEVRTPRYFRDGKFRLAFVGVTGRVNKTRRKYTVQLEVQPIILLNKDTPQERTRSYHLDRQESIELPVEVRLREVRVMHAQMPKYVRLLVILYPAMWTLESRRLLALVPQVR